MVIRSTQIPRRLTGCPRHQRGSLSVELTVAIGILVTVLMPLSLSFGREQAMVRSLYHHAVAMEIVDGEAEVLQAGEWRAYAAGTQAYAVRATAATNLPPGRFVLTVAPDRGRLEWQPEGRGAGGCVTREFSLNPAASPASASQP